MRKKIQTNQEGRVTNPAAITKIPIILAIIYPNNVAVIYLNETAVTYLNKTTNLSELENPRGVRFSHPEIFKRLGETVKEAANWPIRSRVNKEP